VIYFVFTGILLILFQIAALFVIKKWIERQKTAALSIAKGYFESPGDDKPSQFAQFIDLVAQNFSTRILQSARAQLANMSSIDKRQNSKLEADGIQAALPGAISAMPGIGRMIQKNPLLGIAAQYLASKINMGGGGSGPSNGGGSVQVADNRPPDFKL
jgi:hypothetical protein